MVIKKPTRRDVNRLVKTGVADARKAVGAAKKFSKAAVRTIKKKTPTKKDIHAASRVAARTVVSDAMYARKTAGKMVRNIRKVGKEIAAGLKEGVRDARRKK